MPSPEKLRNQCNMSLGDSDLQQLARVRAVLGWPDDVSDASVSRYLVRLGINRVLARKTKRKVIK
jgi:hypothetical protein